uniref:Uncharacterized protein n=1 Tax=viral metagenome TaxID=1070528 RepID=A0A6H1ZQL6_9ZZZZ
MSVSILEALKNAEMNLDSAKILGLAILPLIKEQVYNARILLEKGYDKYEEIEPLLEAYGSVESVPEKGG